MPAGRTFALLLVLRHAGALRNFQSTIEALSERGHRVHLAFESERLKTAGHDRLLAHVEDLDGLTTGTLPAPRSQRLARLGRAERVTRDYLRYLEPVYRCAPALRERALAAVPPRIGPIVSSSLVQRARVRGALNTTLALVERAMPADPALTAYLAGRSPDLVLVSPLVDFGSPQADVLRAARSLLIPTGLLVHSWDNLTNKGLIPAVPDLVAVWNPDQCQEAIELHGIPEANIVVTGAAPYDQWFERTPSSDREAFCRRVGLDPGSPYVLYLCSSPFIAPREGELVRAWIQALRRHGGAVAGSGIVVRPHPQNAKAWKGVDLSDLDQVAVWPRGGADPVDEASRRDYYDAIHHSAAVAGINTSALVESAILGRTVHTLLDGRYGDTQTGTLHFHMLLRHNHGFLRTSTSVEEQAAQLETALTDGPPTRDDAFLRAFVRPHGLAEAATPRLVEAIERTASRSQSPVLGSGSSP